LRRIIDLFDSGGVLFFVTAQLDRLKGFRLKDRRIEQAMDSEYKPEEFNSPFKPNSLTA
jgi:hypothetical protein